MLMALGRKAQNQLAQIQAGLSRVPAQRLQTERRAVVACLLRPSSLASPGSLLKPDSLDVFFILRASSEDRIAAQRAIGNRRWSGQVGFPGGHVMVGESDHEAAARECHEEVGFCLNAPGAYRFLGCVKERKASHKLAVACRVYQQLIPQTPTHLQVGEVAACGWAPLPKLLEDQCAQPLQWSAVYGGDGDAWDGFPSVPLPISDLRVAEGVSVERAHNQFVLWGLTLRIVSDWLQMTGLRHQPISLHTHGAHSTEDTPLRESRL